MKNKITSSWRVPRNLDGQAAVPYLDTKWGLVEGRGQIVAGPSQKCLYGQGKTLRDKVKKMEKS